MTPRASWVTARLRFLEPGLLTAAAASVPVVGIGESCHHTAEEPGLRSRLLAELLGAGGPLGVMLEALPPGPNPIDDYVCDAAAAAEHGSAALVAAGVRMWRNWETVALLDLMREHNRGAGTHRVRVHGIDVLTPGRGMRRALDAATNLGLPEHDVRALTALCVGFDVDGWHDQAEYDRLAPQDRARLHEFFTMAQLAVHRGYRELQAALGATRVAALRRDVTVSVRALDTLAAGSGNWVNGLPHRDWAMAENVAELLTDSDTRWVILGHNTHVAAARSLDGRGFASMGTHLRNWLGSGYRAIGTTFGRAVFDPPIYGVATAPSDDADGSVDSLVARVTTEESWLTLDSASGPPVPRAQAIRSVGAVSHLYSLLAAFDALIHLPVLTTARQLTTTTGLGLTVPP